MSPEAAGSHVTLLRLPLALALAAAALMRDRAGPAALGLASGWSGCERLARRGIDWLNRAVRRIFGRRARLLLEAARLAQLRHLRVSLPTGPSPVPLFPRIAGPVLELHAIPAGLTAGTGLVPIPRDELVAALRRREVARIVLILHGEDVEWPVLLMRREYELHALSQWLASDPERVATIVCGTAKTSHQKIASTADQESARDSTGYYFALLSLSAKHPELVPVLHDCDARRRNRAPAPPFDRGDHGWSWAPARPAADKRSVLFLHNNLYCNQSLAEALRRRGWDAVAASIEAPDGPYAWQYQGEDLCLYDPDPSIFRERLVEFYRKIPERFRLVHFYGQGWMGLFPENFDGSAEPRNFPWDFLELRRIGVKIAYTPNGCLDGVSQTAFRDFTGLCRRCSWELRPDVCSDRQNLAWARRLDLVCDLITIEDDFPLEARAGPKFFREPLVDNVDPDLWQPQIEVPAELRIPREDGELIVYHAFAEEKIRRVDGRDMKGAGAVIAAVERLQREGMKVRRAYLTSTPSSLVRFTQVQADVVIDQLNYGRYGATGREGMMLGKPTICYMDLRQPAPCPPSRALAECPLVSATEATVYEVLKELLLDPERRRRIGEASRAWMLKWHSPNACAARYERVYDRLMVGLPPEADEVFAAEDAAPLKALAA
ncbi:MAG TPA: hypothetical protein VM755_21120 [Stellaceae bacterium]|nr:hypothetical protein [Stellaceae bacterium]